MKRIKNILKFIVRKRFIIGAGIIPFIIITEILRGVVNRLDEFLYTIDTWLERGEQ